MPPMRWNADLHRRFVYAVEILGGEKEAIPKKILGLMNVRGLTITNVKSHLQVYRITKKEETMQDQQHLQYAQFQKTVNPIQIQKRKEEEQHKEAIAFGEPSTKITGFSCKSFFQTSVIGHNETGNDEEGNGDEEGNDDGNNDVTVSLELTLGINN